MTRYAIVADVETDGLRDDCQVIQLAAIAVNQDDWREISSFERKVQFDVSKSEPQALEINHYDPELWKAQAQPPAKVISTFCAWAKPYQSIEMVSAKGTPYAIAKMIGHNIVAFDFRKIKAMNGQGFFPFAYHTPDTLQLAMWFFDLQPNIKRPKNLKLATLAEYFGIDTTGAHDALTDVRLSAAVALAVRDRLFRVEEKRTK